MKTNNHMILTLAVLAMVAVGCGTADQEKITDIAPAIAQQIENSKDEQVEDSENDQVTEQEIKAENEEEFAVTGFTGARDPKAKLPQKAPRQRPPVRGCDLRNMSTCTDGR